MIRVITNNHRVPATELRDGDWVIGDLGDQRMLLRYQDSLLQGDFRPVLVNTELLHLLGFHLHGEQYEGSEVEVFALNDFRISVVNDREFIFEGGERGKIPVHYLHLLQQTWRQITSEELAHDFLEQPHTIELREE